MAWLAAAALAVALLGAIALTGYRLVRAAARNQPLLMQRVLEREGARIDASVDAQLLAQAGAAARRCLLCRERHECLEWLDGRSGRALAQICPNAGLIARLKTTA